VLHFSREGSLPAQFVTFLALHQPTGISVRGLNAESANAYLCTMGESHRLIVLSNQPGVWFCDAVESNAELLVIQFSLAKVEHVLIRGGTETRIDGNLLAEENKAGGVWEAASESLSPTITTALLQVLRRALEWERS
jgi:hypothetical protein